MFAYNVLGKVTTIASSEQLPAGPVTVTYDFVYDGGGPGKEAPEQFQSMGKK